MPLLSAISSPTQINTFVFSNVLRDRFRSIRKKFTVVSVKFLPCIRNVLGLNLGHNPAIFIKYLLDFFLSLRVSTRVGTLIVATIYLQLIQNRYMFRSFTVLQCSHQHCVQPVASDVEVVGNL